MLNVGKLEMELLVQKGSQTRRLTPVDPLKTTIIMFIMLLIVIFIDKR